MPNTSSANSSGCSFQYSTVFISTVFIYYSLPPILIYLLYFRIISGFPRSADRTIVVHFSFVYHPTQIITLFIFGLTTGVRESAATYCIDTYVSSIFHKSPEMILSSSFFHFTTVTTDISRSYLLWLSPMISTLLFSA